MWRQLATLDWVSTVLLLGATSCFTISLQWAGVQKEWKDPAVIGVSRRATPPKASRRSADSLHCSCLPPHPSVSSAGSDGLPGSVQVRRSRY